jgi:hypothetical protein
MPSGIWKTDDMNNFDQAWHDLVQKKPLLNDSGAKVEITPFNLKKLLRQFYDKGLEDSSGMSDFLEFMIKHR